MARDGQGLEVSNANAEAIQALDFAREEWLAFGNRLPEVIAAADKEDKCLLLPLIAVNLMLSMNSADGVEAARRHVARAKAMMSGANARELAWLAAAAAWIAGETPLAQKILEDLVAQWPRDLLAAGVGQRHALAQGDAEGILRIGERIVAANPDNHYVWAMHAFGLGECNRLDEAEAAARKAIALDRRNPLAHLAIAHCLKARGRMVEGVAFLTEMSDTWERCNSAMLSHLRWHLALFLIDLDRTDDALQLYDQHVWDQINAVSLLARLEQRGVDVGDRWADVAAHLKPRLHEHVSPFLDLHYLYGLARAADASAVTEMLASLEDRAEQAKPFEREAWADCAVPAAHGLAAHAKGDVAEAARLLGQAMPHLPAIGGSIAQRGLFGVLHLDALMRADWNDAAMAILQADERERPTVAATKRALAGLYRKVGRTEQAQAAEYQAEQLARQYRAAQGPTTGRAA